MAKMAKNTAVNTMPLSVATLLVARFTRATIKSVRKTQNNPTGISVLPMRRLTGTFQPRSPLYFQRSTSMASELKVKLQITPKAYASPSIMTLPRLTTIVNNCSPATKLMMR